MARLISAVLVAGLLIALGASCVWAYPYSTSRLVGDSIGQQAVRLDDFSDRPPQKGMGWEIYRNLDEVPLLTYAISNGASLEAIEMLVDAGIDITEVNHEGLGVLDIAIKHKRLDILKLCEARGIDLLESRRKSGVTPMILAASFNDMEIVSYLIDKGANVKDRDRYGMSAADYAKRMGQTKMLEFLENQAKS
jgi:ankyrin repeat protein